MSDNSSSKSEALIGQTIDNGRYEVIRVIGEGGMGKVFEARQKTIDRLVAIKVLHAHWTKDPKLVERFKREALTASQFRHPNTVMIHDYGKTESGELFIIMELLKGQSLLSLLDHEAPIPLGRTLRIIEQVTGAIAEVHRCGVIHRDLKPENIQIDPRDGHPDFVKVLDFSIAKIVSDNTFSKAVNQSLTLQGAVFGTPQYMSPEQVRGKKLGHTTDLYAIGVIFYQMLTGEVPFSDDSPQGTMMAHLTEPIPEIDQKFPQLEIHPEAKQIIYDCLEKNPEKRLSSADNLLQRIKRLQVLIESDEGPSVTQVDQKKPSLSEVAHDAQEALSNETAQDRSSDPSPKRSKNKLSPPKSALPSTPSKIIKHTQETEEFNPRIHGPLSTDEVIKSIKESADEDPQLKEEIDATLDSSGAPLEASSLSTSSDHSESFEKPNDPDQESSEPDQESSEPDQESSEPDQESSEPDQESSEPDQPDSSTPQVKYLYTEPLYMNDSSLLKAQLDQVLEDMIDPEDIIEEISQDSPAYLEETRDHHPIKSRSVSLAEAPTIEPQQRRVAQGFQIEEESKHTGLFETPKKNKSHLHLGLIMLSIIIGGFSVFYFPSEVEVAQTIQLGNQAKEIEYTVQSTPKAYIYEYISSQSAGSHKKGIGSWKKLEETPYQWTAPRGEERTLKVSLKGYTSQLISYAGFVAHTSSPAKLSLSIKLTPSKSVMAPTESVEESSINRKANQGSIKKKTSKKKKKSTRKHRARRSQSAEAQRTKSPSTPTAEAKPNEEPSPKTETGGAAERKPTPPKTKKPKKKVPELIPLKDDESIDPTRFKEPIKTSTPDPLKVEKIY